ncbi:AAA family ATPase [Dactylosporangium sp. CA-233914]|uniref:AAA family ATPase n=1 Tax=Dactylosporangium sp. CA-233914 TaxID=3239934 RepID=UPI003D8DDCFF
MRGPQLQLLREQFERCTQGRGGVVVVSGAPATGKTALLRAFGEDVAPAAHVVTAIASRVEQALPMGVIDQLLAGVALPADRADATDRLLFGGVLDAPQSGPPDGAPPVSPALLRGVHAAFRTLCAERPLVIVVDDLQFIDPPSLSCLLYLIRRARSQRILVLIGECTHNSRLRRLLQSEILHLPNVRQLRLGTLPAPGVTALLEQRMDAETAERLTAQCLAITGGNPLLLRALAEELPGDALTGDGPVPGETYRRAVAGCLLRAESSLLDIAHAVAVLGAATSVPLVGEVVAADHQSVITGIDILTESGLLDAGRFRHDAAEHAVLDGMPIELRTRLHRRAADILHAAGAPTPVVARHLAAGRETGPVWACGVLLDGARLALLDGDSATAIGYLRLAHDGAEEPRQRAEITAALAEAQWRVNPSAAKRYLPQLCAAAHAGLLSAGEVTCLLAHLLWQGQYADALRILADLHSRPGVAIDLELLTKYSGTLAPGLSIEAAPDRPEAPAGAAQPGRADPSGRRLGGRQGVWHRAVDVLSRVVLDGPDPGALSEAQQVLHGVRPAVDGVLPAVYAVMALLYGDRPDLAADACDLLLKDDRVRGHPTWRAMIGVARAGVSTRLGDLPEAVERAAAALALLPVADWAAAAGAPLAVMIRANTGMGMIDAASLYLDHPVPDAVFATVFGLEYLSARGHLHLAAGRPGPALDDFRACGRLMQGWSLDRPDLVPWRTDAAEALLTIGEREEALALAEEQLALTGPATRTRGITLCTVAAAGPPQPGEALLREAIGLLGKSGDRLSLARAYADLGATYQELDQPGPARRAATSALRLANRCGARPLELRIAAMGPAGDRADPHPPGDTARPSGPLDRLTDAELRVAVLAAKGHTNLQIARRLFVTVSTVEQHLTRVYRKLQLGRRSQLRGVAGLDIE